MKLDRRQFLGAAAAALAPAGKPLDGGTLVGKLRKEEGETPVAGAAWYAGEAEGDGLEWRFPAGALARMRYLVTDMLLDGEELAVFSISLQEGDGGRKFQFRFGALNQCSLRMRMPLLLVDQSRWLIEREGAFLKPTADGDRVDLGKVDRMTFTVLRKGPRPARWCMTPLAATADDVSRLSAPVLPKGKLLDEMGQSALREWPGKTRSLEEMKRRLSDQLARAPEQVWPATFSRWGGWKANKLTAGAGFFRTRHDGKRWWLADPDGYAFWSAGVDCVRVDCDSRIDGLETALAWMPERRGNLVNYLAANWIRAAGESNWRDRWAEAAYAHLRRLRFNTVGNWSEVEYASKARFPYVWPLRFRSPRAGFVYRDFPDVYHPGFEKDAAECAEQLRPRASDPALVGYFLMNEPTWGFSSELPAAGMLYNTPSCHTRAELARFLKTRYPDAGALAAAWGAGVTFEKVAAGPWQGALAAAALSDLREFSVLMVERHFGLLSKACKQVDANHLNLGMRWAGVPPEWAVKGMRFFDVFSLNCYQEKLPRVQAEKIHQMLGVPALVGEWHFGALDAGLPASGIGHVRTQADRGKAYRVYLEDAAADPYCVGAHWFTLYDESALGRGDGENYNIGFLDVCNRPYEEMERAAIASHERMYEVAAGAAPAFADAPQYLPKLFL
jgi:hypothetical protein